jgi:hypothetical protein
MPQQTRAIGRRSQANHWEFWLQNCDGQRFEGDRDHPPRANCLTRKLKERLMPAMNSVEVADDDGLHEFGVRDVRRNWASKVSTARSGYAVPLHFTTLGTYTK